jgi:hypothetical protein
MVGFIKFCSKKGGPKYQKKCAIKFFNFFLTISTGEVSPE